MKRFFRMGASPPVWADRFLEWFCSPDKLEDIQGDLHEEFYYQLEKKGLFSARLNYWRDVLGFIRPFAIKHKQDRFSSPLFSPDMIRNYFKVAFRNLQKSRLYSTINLIGLSLGLGVAIVLFWIVRFEYSFDRFHTNVDRIYHIRSTDKFGERQSHTPQGVIKTLQEHLPGVEKAANLYGMEATTIKVNNQVYQQKNTFFAPPELLEMLDITWLKGSPGQSLNAPGQVVIDDETAQRLFNGDAMGKVIRYENAVDLMVTGIIQKMPVQTGFPMQMIVSRETLKQLQPEFKNDDYWGGGDSMNQGFVLLKAGASSEAIAKELTKLVQKYHEASDVASYELQPLSQMHFDTTNDPFNYAMPKWTLYTLSSIAGFLVIIACINFINLATVQAVQRSREIGIRKVLGSSRMHIILQFFGETFVLVFAALILGSLMASQLVQYADQLLNTKVALAPVWNISTLLFLLGGGIVITFLSGFYPALLLSGFEPIKVLKSQFVISNRQRFSLRESLVVTQFVIAQVLVICMFFGIKQVQYFYQKDLGFDKRAIITVRMPDRKDGVIRERFRHQLLGHPEIKDVTFGLTTPASHRDHWWGNVLYPGLPNGEETFRLQHIDTSYFRFFKISLAAGRSITATDTAQGHTSSIPIVINEKAAHDMGFQNMEKVLGERLEFWGMKAAVVGVVKDYHSEDLRSNLQAHAYFYASWNFKTASIRIDPAQKQAALQHIRTHWQTLFPNDYYEPKFLDDDLRALYDNERKFSNFLILFACVGIFIGCLGLFGLVSFVVTQRTKEMGIRKVLGATISSLVALLSKDFLKLVVIAFLIASPIAWYAMHQWLQDFVYKIDMDWWVFVMAGVLAMTIALLTVSFQSIKAALENPVKSLRNE